MPRTLRLPDHCVQKTRKAMLERVIRASLVHQDKESYLWVSGFTQRSFVRSETDRQRLPSALGYRSPEEFERKAEGQAEKRDATTIEVFVNIENDERISKGLLGTGTQMPSPSPDPFSC